MNKILHKMFDLRIESSAGGYFTKVIVSLFGKDIIGWKVEKTAYGIKNNYTITSLK